MTQIETCDICGLKEKGKRYEFYYGQFLGTSDYVPGSTGMRSKWKEHYHILGKSSCFLCRKCISREFWKRVFKEPRLPEMRLGVEYWAIPWLGIIFGFVLLYGISSIAKFFGFTIGEKAIALLTLFCLALGWLSIYGLNKLLVYSIDFGNEMAYRTRLKELPQFPKLICIPPSLYKAMESPIASKQAGPKPSIKTPLQQELSKLQRVPGSLPGKQMDANISIKAELHSRHKENAANNDHTPEGKSAFKICPKCGMKVLPKSDGTCPSCQSKIV